VLLDETREQALRVEAIYPPWPVRRAVDIALSSQPAVASAVQSGLQIVWEEPQRGAHALAALMGTQAGPAIVQPMFCQSRALGVLVAMNGHSRRAFSESEQRVMEAFGAQVAAAAENAQLSRMLEAQAYRRSELLRAREEEASRRAAILESIADGVIVFDENERAIAANPAAHAILDLPQVDVIGKPLREVMDKQVHPEDYAIIHSRIESGQPLPPGFKVIWGRRTVALSVAPVELSLSNRSGTVMVMRDITHDAEVDRMKNEFVTVVSHELRSPFAALDSSLQVIQKYGLEHLLPEQRDQVQQLAEGLKHAETMINNLVTFASFLSKQGQLWMSQVDVGQLARETAQMLDPMAQARGVRLSFQIGELVPPVYGDRDRLAEAIYHLAHNAIRFNRQDGVVKLTCRSESDSVILEVADTGLGIAPDKLPEIWRDFAQLADPLRRGMEGLGLGLPLVRYVIKAHGGHVWARSVPGRGSLFGFSLPAAQSAQLSPSRPRQASLTIVGGQVANLPYRGPHT
jgi:PAS domain S-box-containing protein